MKITYSFASRSRPDKFFAALNNIRAMSANSNYEVIAKLDYDDKAMTDRIPGLTKLKDYPEVIVKWGLSENKVHAINRDLEDMTGEILMCHSDDMVFTKKGFDNIIREHMEPDTYLHFPDGYANERLSTYSIMHIDYYKRFDYIYNPEYKNTWCDNEQTEVAKKLYRYKFINENILEHIHPSAGKAPKDAQYKLTEKTYTIDKGVFLKRQRNNFDLPEKVLSILICSLDERKEYLQRLISVLKPQLTPETEVKLCIDNRELTTGAKRNKLLSSATGKYVVFIDDDDLISEDYVSSILQAAKENKDAIVFNGWMTTNGNDKKLFRLSRDYAYQRKDDIYLRYNNHITPIQKNIAKQFKFPEINYKEDYEWATQIHKSGLIKTETKINKDLYYYLYQSK